MEESRRMSLGAILGIVGLVSIVVCYFAFFGAATIFTLPLVIRHSIMAYKSKCWISTQGNVVPKMLELKDNTGKKIFSHGTSYHYQVQGVDYESDRVEYDGEDSVVQNNIRLETFISTRPGISQINVYYNPTNPKLSVLRPGIHGKIIAVLRK